MATKRNPMARSLSLKQFSQKVLPTKKQQLLKVKHKKQILEN